MSIKVEGIEEFNKKVKELSSKVATKKEKQSIVRAGAPPVVAAAKKIVRKADKDYPFFQKGKEYTIKVGNLRDSIMYFKQRDGDVSIGPRRLKKLSSKTIGGGKKTSSGFYAAAHYKSASLFKSNVTEKALSQSTQKTLKAMDKAVERILKKYD
jgi:hypothetical protein